MNRIRARLKRNQTVFVVELKLMVYYCVSQICVSSERIVPWEAVCNDACFVLVKV